MRLRPALVSASAALVLTSGAAFAAPSAKNHRAMMTPSITLKSVIAKGTCVTAKVAVSHFKLVKPVYKAPMPMLKGDQGHIHYVLNGMGNFVATRDATTSLSHTWCGHKMGVKMGKNSVKVYLATSEHAQFPHTMARTRTVTVK